MKRKPINLIVAFIITVVISCNEPETVVTNYVHTDGSVTRKIEMKSSEGDVNKRFKISDIQVPLDSTWTVKDSCEVTEKGDTIWVRREEKLFKSVDEINLAYKSDSGANKEAIRNAGFKKRFKWFNTEFRFSERIDKRFSFGYIVNKFLNNEELLYFYSPESLKQEKKNGPDSLKFRILSDSVDHKTEIWAYKNLASEWIGEFSKLATGKTGDDLSYKSLKIREDEFVKIVKTYENNFDSLWSNGFLLKKLIGDANALEYKTQADSALKIVIKNFMMNFEDYSVRIAMPGKLIGTNGFIDRSKVLFWPVKSDYFLTEPYEMWAESKISNTWAWIASGFFLVFVLTGVIMRLLKKD